MTSIYTGVVCLFGSGPVDLVLGGIWSMEMDEWGG